MNPAIRAENLVKIYSLYNEKIVALKGISLTIQPGEFVSIMGPSGAGKTTFLNLVGCLDKATEGRLEVLGAELNSLDEKATRTMRLLHVGFVFQEFFLLQSLTALENVWMPLFFARRDKDIERAKALLERMGLSDRMQHLPKELSGGEMQRVAIARALANRPDILLADEPTGNLDTKNAQAIYDLFRQLAEEEKITVVAATHNTKLGHQAGRVVHLREGVIEQDEIVSHKV
jgi:putative ABC transport system ATP-binding protein